jgi:tRNA A37 threonylcarbamoyladenosine synthetase subunit TsaC/SUA5/YrdC
LGLFHYEKRITSTPQHKHIDYLDAISELLNALYQYEPTDYKKLLKAFQNGSLSLIAERNTQPVR